MFNSRALALDLLLLASSSLLCFLVLGYHPYAEDGGIYAASIAGYLDPSLFPIGHEWVTAHTRFACFVPATAWFLRHAHLSLAVGLLVVQLTGIVALLAAGLELGRSCFPRAPSARWGTALLAVAAGMPIAGTSLYLVDPYVTARTFTTPLLLWSVCALLNRRRMKAVLFWIAALTLHPLMACWGSLPLLFVVCLRQKKPERWTAALSLVVLSIAGLVSRFAKTDQTIVHSLAETRGYWFIALWRWYEWLGVLAPLALLLIMGWSRRLADCWTDRGREMLRAACLAGALMASVALLCIPVPGRSTLLARVQPLRTFHEVYCLFVCLLGGAFLHWLSLKWGKLASAILLGTIAAGMFAAQRSIYPGSQHLEFPWRRPSNDWQQAFLWVRENTPTPDLFAMDPNYTEMPREDAQGFRATALRSSLPDKAKDGGIAAVMPELATVWKAGVGAQTCLNDIGDTERRLRLLPLGVGWLILPAASKTGLPCPYRNLAVKVCRLSPTQR